MQTALGEAENLSVTQTNETLVSIQLQKYESLQRQFALLEERLNQEVTAGQECQCWEAAYKRLEVEHKKLRDDHDSLRVQSFGRVSDGALHELKGANQRVAELEEKVRQLQSQHYSGEHWPERQQIDLRDLQNQHREISCNLESLFSGQHFIARGSTVAVSPGSALEALFQKAHFLDHPTVVDQCEPGRLRFIDDLQLISQALIAAALCLWVFDADMRDLFPSMGLGSTAKGHGRLLEKFRKLLKCKGVWDRFLKLLLLTWKQMANS